MNMPQIAIIKLNFRLLFFLIGVVFVFGDKQIDWSGVEIAIGLEKHSLILNDVLKTKDVTLVNPESLY